MTWVAPRDWRYAVWRRDEVVMMGEKPWSFASWIAIRPHAYSSHPVSQRRIAADGELIRAILSNR